MKCNEFSCSTKFKHTIEDFHVIKDCFFMFVIVFVVDVVETFRCFHPFPFVDGKFLTEYKTDGNKTAQSEKIVNAEKCDQVRL